MHAEAHDLVNPVGLTDANLVSRVKTAVANAFSMPTLATTFA